MPISPSRFVSSRRVWFGFFGLSVILPSHTSTGFLARAPPYYTGLRERPTNDLPHPRPAWVSGGPLLTPIGAFGFNVGRLGDLPRPPQGAHIHVVLLSVISFECRAGAFAGPLAAVLRGRRAQKVPVLTFWTFRVSYRKIKNIFWAGRVPLWRLQGGAKSSENLHLPLPLP